MAKTGFIDLTTGDIRIEGSDPEILALFLGGMMLLACRRRLR